MGLKDIFNIENKKKNNLTTVNFQNLSSLGSSSLDVESVDFITAANTDFTRFIPPVDYGTASNFAKFGLAERYYEESIDRVVNLYPFDGSLKEKREWRNGSTALDLYLFDNEYPKTTGYVNLAPSGWGTKSGALVGGYGLPTTVEYVSFFNRAVNNLIENVYDGSAKRRENTRFIFATGSTIEFWLKKNAFADSANQTLFETVFYTATSGSDNKDKALSIYLAGGTGTGSVFVEYDVNQNTAPSQQFSFIFDTGLSTIADSTWHHYAFVFGQSVDQQYSVDFYLDGNYKTTKQTIGKTIVDMTGSCFSTLGAVGGKLNTNNLFVGYGKLSGSIDEFRFWNNKRNAKQIGRYYITSEIGDGTNTDDANTDLGVHFKFNEGIVGDSGVDAKVLDYSGRQNDGTFVGYSTLSRSTGSAIDDAGFSEPQDPIIYANNPTLVSYKQAKMDEGRTHDFQNAGNLYKKFPAFMLDDDEQGGFVLRNLTQIMASYLDQLYLQIEYLPKLKQIDYTLERDRPHEFYAKALESAGFPAVDLFADIEAFNRYYSRDEKQLFQKDFEQIKNRILQNIYNNLPYILKSKGNEKSFRNFIRCFGVDDETYKINLYNDNFDYIIQNRYKNTTINKNYIDFNNDATNTEAVVYSYPDASNANSIGYISCSTNSVEKNIANTYEVDVIFPLKPEFSDPKYVPYDGLYSSIFGVVAANASSPTDTTVPTNNLSNFELYAVRPESLSNNVYFVLSSSYSSSTAADNFNITTSIVKNIYDDQRWNFAVRIKPQGYDIGNLASPTSPTNYTLELYGVSVVGDYKVQEISASTTIGYDRGLALLSNPRRLYVGSKRTNVTGTLFAGSDLKVASTRVWFDYLDNDTVYNNAIQGNVYGNEYAYRSAYLGQTQLSGVFIPKIDTLAVNWQFNQVYSASADGTFTVIDNSSGSATQGQQKYGILGNIIKSQHTGRGDYFKFNSKVVSKEFLPVSGKKLPEQVSTDDTVQILNQDDLAFTKESRPIRTYISIERSMYQTISDEMMKLMSSISEFANLIGERQNQYRHEYKDMAKLRSLFFESIGNTPDLDKYVEYYKWLDFSLNRVIVNLFPASADFSEEVNVMVEDHVLERSKYRWKFPTMEFKPKDKEAGIQGINKLLYNWKYGHAPIQNSEATSSFWWLHRAERDGRVLSSSNADVNSNKKQILSVSYQVLDRSYTTPVKYSTDKVQNFVGGAALLNKKFDYYKSKKSDIVISPFYNKLTPDTTDYTDLHTKYDAQEVYSVDDYKSRFASPFSYYQQQKTKLTNEITTNYLDVYGPHYEVPMQSPFTEKYVGGNFYRHQTLFSSGSNRAEAYVLTSSGGNRVIRNRFNVNPNLARSDFYREELAKRPVSIKNIAHTTGSTIIGNYDKKYQYFQTSDRKTNNPFFVRNNGFVVSSSADPYVFGAANWQLPTRTRIETIFVERFSAPGDALTMNEGALDPISAQFSVYNSLPWRNLKVRNYLNSWWTQPNYHNYVSGTLTASYHKIPKNSYTNLAGSTNNDNAWIQHPIPQCNINYSWIYDSVTATSSCDSYEIGSASNLVKTDGTALAQPVDYVGTNFYVFDPIFTGSLFLGTDTTTNGSDISSYINSNNGYYTLSKEAAFNALMSHRNGAYGYPSWKQIRNNALTNYLKNNNLLSITKPNKVSPTLFLFSSLLETKFTESTTLYKEAPITSNNPVEYKLQVSNYNNGVFEASNADLKITYFNNRQFFNNVALNDFYVDQKLLPKLGYEQIQELIKIKNTSKFSPIKYVNEIKYVEKIFPRKVNSYLGVIRTRTNYTETQTQKDSSDFTNRRTFWRDSLANRIRTAGSVNSQGNVLLNGVSVITSSVYPLDSGSSTVSSYGVFGELLAGPRGTTTFVTNLLTASANYVNLNDPTQFPQVYVSTFEDAGIKPWYDSYDSYSEDIRTIAKDYSVIPEFRISEHMPYYVSGTDFNFYSKENINYLSLNGASLSSSNQADFYKVYSHTDFISNFVEMEKDAKNAGFEPSDKKIKVKMSAVKKLLPYNGFYPSTRLLQMAQIFSSSYSGTTTGGWLDYGGQSGSGGGYNYAPFFALFYSPGVIFNTIKSGIAVDYPAHTGTVTTSSLDYTRGCLTPADYRIRFEAAISPNAATLPVNQVIGSTTVGGTFGSASWVGKKNDSLYELAANNFFGESIRFFLKDSGVQTFVSKKQSDYPHMKANNTYYMDITLKKNPDNFVMYEGTTYDAAKQYAGIQYGPAYQVSGATNALNDPSFAAVTPPYFYGKSTVRVSFTPTESRPYSPSEIIAGLTSSYFNSLDGSLYSKLLSGSSAASSSIMKIDASINYKNVVALKQVSYDGDLNATQIFDQPSNSGYDVWVISPKYETPIFNFSSANTSYDRGMWVNYKADQGKINEGVFLELSDPFSQQTNKFNSTTGSLIDICGFNINNGAKKLGQLPDTKEISEAIVAIPIDSKNSKYLITSEVYKALQNPKYKSETKAPKPSAALIDMYNKMQNYVFPPHLDFINNPSVKPYSMYIFEFKHTLTKLDLAKIWQNVMPEIATRAELDEQSVEHGFGPGEIFVTNFDPLTKWIVFKVKRKAENNYYNTVAGASQDTRFDFNFQIGNQKISAKNSILPYSYNWPYDFFSLVELAKIDTEVSYNKNKE